LCLNIYLHEKLQIMILIHKSWKHKCQGHHLSMKKIVCLFCLSCWNLWHHSTICPILDTIGKSSMNRGVLNWFHNVVTNGGEIIEYWTKISLKIHLNQNSKLQGNFGAFLIIYHYIEKLLVNEFDESNLGNCRLKSAKNIEFWIIQ